MTDSILLPDYQPAPGLLRDKIILVTGAGDGIGKTASLTFAAHGATVILLGRTIAKLEAVYDQIEAAGGAKPAIIPMNFEGATEQDYVEIHNVLEQEFGRLDGLLHNAAELGPRTPVANYGLEAWQKVMTVNVTAPFQLTKAVMPLLKQAPSASVVFTSSGVGRKGHAYWGGYAVSKAASDNLMETLADEMDGLPGPRVNALNPGPVRTRMRATAFPAEDPATVTDAQAVMSAYLYLMGDDSIGVNGKLFDAQATR